MATVCQDSKCETGGDGVCCHECDKADNCRDLWKCEDPTFYADCKENGGICGVTTDIFDWRPQTGKEAP